MSYPWASSNTRPKPHTFGDVTTELDFSKLVPATEFVGEDDEDDKLVRDLIDEAHAYVGSFVWCRAIEESYVSDIAVGGVVAVLLLRINPGGREVDEWLWVVVGDLPPAYITTDVGPNAACALDGYMGEMQAWVEAAKAGRSVDDLIPVETAGHSEQDIAEMLDSRLDFLNREILSHHADDLQAAE